MRRQVSFPGLISGYLNADGPWRDGEGEVSLRRAGRRLRVRRARRPLGWGGVGAVTVVATPCLPGAAKAGVPCPHEQGPGALIGTHATYRAEPLVTDAWHDVSWGPQSEKRRPDTRSGGSASSAPLSASSRRRAEDWLAQPARTHWREACVALMAPWRPWSVSYGTRATRYPDCGSPRVRAAR